MGKCPVVPPAGGGEKPFVVGTYTGDGGAGWRKITLGFQPSAVLVESRNGSRTKGAGYDSYGGLALPGVPAYALDRDGKEGLRIVEDGFEVTTSFNANNWFGLPYRYIAFR